MALINKEGNKEMAGLIQDTAGHICNISLDNTDLHGNIDDWIPGQAHKLANDFRLHHGNDLSPELITELLRNLNNIWRIREKKAVARNRAKCNEEIVNLKRQMNAKMPMDTIILSK